MMKENEIRKWLVELELVHTKQEEYLNINPFDEVCYYDYFLVGQIDAIKKILGIEDNE